MSSITRSDFVSEELPWLFRNKYRIRLLETSAVPIVGDLSAIREKELIVVDLPSNEKQHSKLSETSECGNTSAITDSSDQAGSPLKFSFITLEKLRQKGGCHDATFLGELDCSKTTFECNPLPSPDGRRLANSLATGEWPFDRETFKTAAIWIVMDASDAMKTAFLGISRMDDLIILYNIRCFARGDPTVEDYIQPKFRFLDHLQATFTAYCSYDLIPSMANRDTDAAMRITANVQLLASWRAKRDDFLVNPPHSASVTLSVCVGWLDRRLPYSEWSQELCILLALGNALRTGTMSWQPIDPNVTSEQLNASVKALLEEEQLGQAEPAGDWAEYRDLSERLWVLLKNCTSSRMLIGALQIVWEALRSGYKNTMMHSNNKSTIARLMKDACAGDLKLPRLEGLTPLEILLEVGLEYFHRSCVHEFISNEFVASGNELESLYSINPRASTEDRADAMFVLYQALVAMSCCKQFLHFETQRRNILARCVLLHYSTINISPTSNGTVTEDTVRKLHLHLDMNLKLNEVHPTIFKMCVLLHYSTINISPTSNGTVTEDTVRKLHLHLDMNLKLNEVHPTIFKIKTPTTWRKESVYMDGKNTSYIIMTHFTKATKLAHIASKSVSFEARDVPSMHGDETTNEESNIHEESNENSDETKSENKLLKHLILSWMYVRA
ncbi:Protein zwilch -like protein [Toxocara canis]|uniref:Protein zwilch n=1 Tax=Toxocara canis TaxID=6265 RepID=A0A0B2W2U2_TOXCA|nr:Protein zwilch -like protein [Toxocara canis]